MTKLFLSIAALLFASWFVANSPDDPVAAEIGSVKWNRDYQSAKKIAAESETPLMLLFQEVPG
ncbi:hypothetical protein MFFC18_43400 [Mariniblastus fucicola]|nr:hypothetical protein MFFC18_43400 [Mariniblastus fucicola]